MAGQPRPGAVGEDCAGERAVCAVMRVRGLAEVSSDGHRGGGTGAISGAGDSGGACVTNGTDGKIGQRKASAFSRSSRTNALKRRPAAVSNSFQIGKSYSAGAVCGFVAGQGYSTFGPSFA